MEGRGSVTPSECIFPSILVKTAGLYCYWFSHIHVQEYEMKIMGKTTLLD